MLIGDGGLAENTDLSSLLRRGVHRIVLCQSTDTPLNPHWNATQMPTAKDVDDELAAFFGVFIDSDTHPGYTYNRNQYFDRSDFAELAGKLQTAQATGKGAVATVTLKTVRNDWCTHTRNLSRACGVCVTLRRLIDPLQLLVTSRHCLTDCLW